MIKRYAKVIKDFMNDGNIFTLCRHWLLFKFFFEAFKSLTLLNLWIKFQTWPDFEGINELKLILI